MKSETRLSASRCKISSTRAGLALWTERARNETTTKGSKGLAYYKRALYCWGMKHMPNVPAKGVQEPVRQASAGSRMVIFKSAHQYNVASAD